MAMAIVSAGAASGQEVAAPEQPAEQQPSPAGHLVNEIRVRFSQEHPRHPAEASLLQATVTLVETPEGLSPPADGQAGRTMTLAQLATLPNPRLSDRGLAAIAPAVVRRLKGLGFGGVYVVPDPAEFAVEEGRAVDRRAPGSGRLTLNITMGVVTEVRTTAIGERVASEQKVNNPLHARIRLMSPIQPGNEESGKPPDLYRSADVDDFAIRLSRHPGRRVDAAVSPTGTESGAIALDYLVTENKPWLIVGQVSNTGTEETSRVREHIAFIHNNLTNNDDILGVGYYTANFSDSHTVYGSYEAPFGDNREWRYRAFGQGYVYDASEVGLAGEDFEGDGWSVGGEAIWNFYQDHALFLDLVAGAQFKNVSVDNNLAGISGDDNFLVPHLRLRAERHREVDRTDAEVGVEFNLADVAGTDDDLDALGRTDADADWVLLKGRATHSFYVEPLLAGEGGEPTAMAHEIALALEGQEAFGYRLVPNETQVLGGLYTVRGYPESIVAGDSAIVASLEYRYHIARNLAPDPTPGAFFGRPFRFVPQYKFGPTDWDWTLKGFVDAGRVVNSDREAFESDHTLVGVGIGTEIAYRRNASLRVEWGIALNGLEDAAGNSFVDEGDNEIHFVLTLVY